MKYSFRTMPIRLEKWEYTKWLIESDWAGVERELYHSITYMMPYFGQFEYVIDIKKDNKNYQLIRMPKYDWKGNITEEYGLRFVHEVEI